MINPEDETVEVWLRRAQDAEANAEVWKKAGEFAREEYERGMRQQKGHPVAEALLLKHPMAEFRDDE